MRLTLPTLIAALVTACPARSADAAAPSLAFAPAKEAPARAELISEVLSIAPGEPFRVALKIKHAPHWHTYFLNPGQVGMPPAVKWELPAGFSASPLLFPVPLLGSFAGAPFYGYEGETYFLQTLTAPDSIQAGERITLTGKASWLACKEQCVPGRAALELTLPVATTTEIDPTRFADFAAADASLPQSHPAWTLTASESGDTVTLHLRPGPGAVASPEKVHFFSRDSIEDATQAQTLTKEGDAWKLAITRNPETDPRPTALNGILKSDTGWTEGNPSTGIDVRDLVIGNPPGNPASTTATDAPAIPPGLLKTLALMFVGGLILNLMPCVFPVIGLKIMGFVQQSGHDRKQVVKHGLSFTSGVLFSFWILCALLLAGGIRNWGGQLQNPWVVLSLLLVMLVFGLSMFGVFELGSSATGVGGKLANKDGLSGSFFSGVLATVVATPCSAPFLGSGLAATVALPPPLFVTSFTCMALGLSLPYLLLSFFPSLVDKLPRPGPWMESFKQGMSFLLFGTVAFLTWVYLLQVGDQLAGQKSLHVLLGLTVIAAGFWIYGRWSVPYRSPKARILGRIFATAFLLGGFLLSKPSPAAPVVADAPVIHWQDWSKEKQDALLRDGKSVYVDFTARWCLTCQTNKAAAYTEATARLFQEHGIVALKADKTTDNPEIDAELTRLGQVAIPVNVFYAKGKPQPHITQTVLSAGYLQDFIRQHLGSP
ncbi:MAG: hypothetical protein EAZ65_05470 [Verrucomicrobia bacterium]|nr:MAG: hypothetical protein EAZ84_01015 [Verrucomicrobiota bacterium]TAE87870.1 MAG: hypothetical protein EAZ82_06555 [Verrucomicrobiota bacterium]TAF25613.1 MAG: hypothetical protein EAZ71_07480 [Verrucomicrobiota bacterium]TAF41321.1 MAG: hypothetical protein EAZ65_05470 [Verrucomicrobiota bacterium]